MSIFSISTIHLRFNNLRVIPQDIDQFYHVDDIFLPHNLIREIPKELFYLNLKLLDISNNKISTLPKDIIKLVNLKRLSINNNKIKYLPKEIFNFKFIYITFDYNVYPDTYRHNRELAERLHILEKSGYIL